jgi:dipeptidyl aminopeptidase/acylaminoacyl peptidase
MKLFSLIYSVAILVVLNSCRQSVNKAEFNESILENDENLSEINVNKSATNISANKGMLTFILKEMQKDGINADIVKNYTSVIKKAINEGNDKKLFGLIQDAIHDAYGIRMWMKVTFKSSDYLEIPAFLSLPAVEKNLPGLVMVHGGSNGSARSYMRHSFLMAKKGFACLAVDYRSSIGHGDYLKYADDPPPGGKEFDDVIAAVKYLKAHKQINAEKIGVIGSSRGAYISAYVGTRIALQSLVLNFGGYDAAKLLKNGFMSKEDLQKLIYYHGGIEKFKDVLFERSPINFAENISGPVQLIHGSDDSVVKVDYSIDFSTELERNNKIHQLKIYPEAPHGFIFQNTQQAKDAFNDTMKFLDNHLK